MKFTCKYCKDITNQIYESIAQFHCKKCKAVYTCNYITEELISIRIDIGKLKITIYENINKTYFYADGLLKIDLDYLIDDLSPSNAEYYYEKLMKVKILD